MFTCRKIVVAVDFGIDSCRALQLAAAIAADMPDCRLHLLHVVDEPICGAWSVRAPDVDGTTLHKPWMETAQKRLEALVTTLGIDPTHVACTVVAGSPYQEIARHAEAIGASLIVLGSHGYCGLKRLAMGSVAQRVLRDAGRPVIVVPHDLHRMPARVPPRHSPGIPLAI